MDCNDELKEIDFKNRACYYFNDMKSLILIKILIEEKSYENILVYNIYQKTFNNAKTLRIRFDKIDGFMRVYDGTRYLVLI